MEIFILNLYFVISPQIHNLPPKKCFDHHPQVFPGKPPYLNMTTVMTLPVLLNEFAADIILDITTMSTLMGRTMLTMLTTMLTMLRRTLPNTTQSHPGEDNDNVDNVQAHMAGFLHQLGGSSSGTYRFVKFENWLKIDSKYIFKRLQVTTLYLTVHAFVCIKFSQV